MPDLLNSDGDLGRHITVGNIILETGALPRTDIFSNTRYGQLLVLHEWLSEVLFALAYRVAGLNGVAWLTAFVIALIYLVLAVGMRALGVSAPFAFLGGLAACITGAIHLLPRPHLFALLCFTILLVLLELYRRNERARWLVRFLPIMVLWANFNGSFVLAFMVLGVYVIGAVLERNVRRAGTFAAMVVACFVASWVNPYGISLPQYVVGFMGNRFLVDNTVEYLSPNFHNISAWFFAAWIVGSIIVFGRTTTRTSWTGLLLLGAWTAFGLYSARNIPNYAQVAAIVTVPFAEVWLTTLVPAAQRRLDNLSRTAPIGAGWVWGVAAIVLLIALQANGMRADARGAGNVFMDSALPVRAADKIAAAPPPGKMFNEYTWGGYLLYRLYPAQRVFIDGDNDFYGEGLVRDYLDIVNAQPGWQEKLKQYDVGWVIISPQRALARELTQSGEWVEWYSDAEAVVWVRK